MSETVPSWIRQKAPLDSGRALEQTAALSAAELASQNRVLTSLIGQGYYGTVTCRR